MSLAIGARISSSFCYNFVSYPLLSNLFDVWDGHRDGGAGNCGHGVGGATKEKSLDDVVLFLSCVSTQKTGTGGSAKTDPFSAQNPILETSSKNPDLCTTTPHQSDGFVQRRRQL